MIQLSENLVKILIDLILATAAIIITKRDILSLIATYSMQSLLLAVMAGALYLESGSSTLLYLAVITLLSKVLIIPSFMRRIQKDLQIKRDVTFHFLSPITALFTSLFIILFVYSSLSKVFADLQLSGLFLLGATAGVSLAFMGIIVIFTRKQTITNIVGYLVMENGALLFSLFLTELPLLVEILIVIDVIMLTLLSAIFAFGIDSTIEAFHAKFISVNRKAGRGP